MDSAGIYRRPLSLVSLLSQPSHTAARRPVSFLALLRRSAEQAAQRSRQRPFANRVAGVQGVVGPDRVERISSRDSRTYLRLSRRSARRRLGARLPLPWPNTGGPPFVFVQSGPAAIVSRCEGLPATLSRSLLNIKGPSCVSKKAGYPCGLRWNLWAGTERRRAYDFGPLEH